MDTLSQDIRYAATQTARSPGFAVIVILTLALAVGANTAIYSVVHGVLLEPMAYDEPGRLVMVWERNLPRNRERNVVAAVNFLEWRERNTVFEDMAAMFSAGVVLGGGERSERVQASVVSPSFFRILRTEAAVGRTFMPEEERPGNDDVVVLSHGFWQARFGGDPDVIGTTITLDGGSYTIVGVMPAGFRGPRVEHQFTSLEDQDIWAPLALGESPEYTGRALMVLARMKPGVAVVEAQEEMSTIARRLAAEHEYNRGWGVTVVPLEKQVVGDVRRALFVPVGAVGFLLLTACTAVSNLLLARGSGRGREMAVRTAPGADRRRPIRRPATESGVLAVLGGTFGLAMAYRRLDALLALAYG